MSASVPWSVNAVEPEAWAAARDAARRSGMSVGEWLEAAIRQNAVETNSRRGRRRAAPPPPAPDDRLEDLAEQLDELIGLAPDFAQASQQSARVNAGIHRSLNALNDRIEALMTGVRSEPKLPMQLQTAIERLDKRLEALLTVEPVPAQTPPEVERKLSDIARNIDTMKGRFEYELQALAASERAPSPSSPEVDRKLADIARNIDTIKGRFENELQALAASERAPAPPSPEVDRKLADIVSNLETMNKRFEEAERAAAAAPPASIAELDAAVAEITMHQSALDGEEPSPDLQRRFAAIHASLEQTRRESQLSELEQQFRTMIDEVHALRRDSVPTEGVESLRREIGELSHKLSDLAPRRSLEALERAVDALAQRIDRTGVDGNDNLAQVVDALKLIRLALAEVQPAENFAAVERDLHSLSNKLDALGSKGVDHLTVSRLQSEASEIRQVLANALPSDALKALVEQIELLVSKFEQVASSGDATVRDLVGGLERRIEGLAGQLENAAQGTPNTEALTAIGSRIDALQRALERGGGRTNGGLEPLLHTLADKVDNAQARLGNLDAIERELSDLSSGLREVRGSVAEAAEHAARSAVRELAAGVAAAKPAPRPAAPLEVKPTAVARTPIAEALSIPVVPPAAAEQRPRAVQPAERPVPVDGELPADFPLEPGSGSPRARGAQSAAERVALSEAALGTFAPAKPAATETRATDFIAAARRAAQAANAETARVPEEKTGQSRMLALLSSANPKTTRTVAIGLASMLLIYGAIRYYDVVLPLFTFSAKSSKVDDVASQAKLINPAQVAPQAKLVEPIEIVPPAEPTPKVQMRAEERDFGVPPAGMLASQPPPSPPPATPVIDPEETGSTTPPPAARLTAAPPVAVFAGASGELPANLGPASLRAAALAGDSAAAYEIGARWFEGRGIAPNGEQAQRWFEQAVAKGSMHAAYRLGSMHEKGQGIPKNLNEARRLYLMAAEAGHAKAMHNLAVLHAEGIDGKPDMRAAARWFRLGADRGVRDSQYNLGVMYARGAGVTQNLAESYRWFALAAMQGDTEAGKKRDDVAARLDAQSLVAAKLAVQTWTATPLDAAVNDVQVKAEWQKAAEAPTPRKKSTKN